MVVGSSLRSLVCAVALALGASLAGCSSSSESPAEVDPLASCDVKVDPFKELMIVDESVMSDARSRNATAGPWSFRYAFEQMVPPGANAAQFVKDWLLTWVKDGEFNGVTLDRPGESRAETMQEIILCPWMQRSPANKCSASCSTCDKQDLDLAQAPFRLAAIVNRMDLRGQLKPTGKAGESRFVYSLTLGAADDPASKPAAMTIILEYVPSASRNASEWAAAWHGLSKFPSFDEPYKAELEKVTTAFAKHGTAPERANSSSLSQLRTNESVLNWVWQLREFRIDDATGQIRLNTTANTPTEALNNSAALGGWVAKNAEAIRSGQYEVPTSFLGGSSDSFIFRWTLPGVDEPTRTAFVAGTCNGCHSQDNANRNVAFHVSPFKQGVEKLSPFVWDPNKQLRLTDDDLTTRAKLQRRLLCGDLTTSPPASPH